MKILNLPFANLKELSHEMRIPLSGILGVANLLQIDDLTREQAELVNVLIEAINRLSNTTDLILNSPVRDIKTYSPNLFSSSSENVALAINEASIETENTLINICK